MWYGIFICHLGRQNC